MLQHLLSFLLGTVDTRPPTAPAPVNSAINSINYNSVRTEKDWNPSGQAASITRALDQPIELAPSPWSNPQSGSGLVVPGNGSAGGILVAHSDGAELPRVVAQPASVPHATRVPAPHIQKVNKRQVILSYEVSKYGPAGVGSVELYLTKDDGKTWRLYSTPQPLDVALPPGVSMPLQQSLTVTLPGEGVYGFHLVVKNKVGLGKAPPQSGDAPQMRVEVDETPPHCDLYGPMPDPTRRDSVIITWVATDNRPMPATPVTLEWAERETGDWHLIGGGELPNTGRFSWQVPMGTVPPKVFLRLMVRDEAGNIAVAQTNQEVLIDLTEPEITIKDLRVVGQVR